MSTKKVFLTLETELLAEARDVAGARELSSYVDRALRHQLRQDRLTGLLAEFEQEKGPIEPEVMEEVRRAWSAPGEKPLNAAAAKRLGTQAELGQLAARFAGLGLTRCSRAAQ